MSSSKGKKAKSGKKGKGAAKPKKAAKPTKGKPAAAAVATDEATAEAVEASAETEPVVNEASAEADSEAEPETAEAEQGEGQEQEAVEAPAELAAAEGSEGEGAPVEGTADDDAPIEAPIPAAGTAVADLPRADQKRLLESLVFVSDRAINSVQLGRMLKLKSAYAKELVEELMIDYQGRGIELVELSGGYQFRSAPSSAHVVREHIAQPPVRLTRAQLETLALVAYRQPITRPEIDDVRGVDSGSALRVLLERGLLKMLGRKDEPGRPLLYGTTPFFLDFFGMRSLKDLPTLREFTELSDENRALFKRKTGETIEEAEAALLAAEEAAQRDSLSPPTDPAADSGEADGPQAAAADEAPSDEGEREAQRETSSESDFPTEAGEPSDRDLEVEAETFAAGSLQTSPDSSPSLAPNEDEDDDDFEDDDEDDGDDDEQELPQAPEA